MEWVAPRQPKHLTRGKFYSCYACHNLVDCFAVGLLLLEEPKHQSGYMNLYSAQRVNILRLLYTFKGQILQKYRLFKGGKRDL